MLALNHISEVPGPEAATRYMCLALFKGAKTYITTIKSVNTFRSPHDEFTIHNTTAWYTDSIPLTPHSVK